jgi:hypothetical protein
MRHSAPLRLLGRCSMHTVCNSAVVQAVQLVSQSAWYRHSFTCIALRFVCCAGGLGDAAGDATRVTLSGSATAASALRSESMLRHRQLQVPSTDSGSTQGLARTDAQADTDSHDFQSDLGSSSTSVANACAVSSNEWSWPMISSCPWTPFASSSFSCRSGGEPVHDAPIAPSTYVDKLSNESAEEQGRQVCDLHDCMCVW